MMPTKILSLSSFAILGLLFLITYQNVLAGDNDQVDVTTYITTLTSERIKAEDRVKQIKAKKDLPAADAAKARKLYNDEVLARFKAFTTYAAFTIRAGKKPTKEEIQNEVTLAVAGNKEFCDFVDTTLNREKDGKFVTELIVIGEQLYKLFKKIKDEKREATATAFEKITVWNAWDDIK